MKTLRSGEPAALSSILECPSLPHVPLVLRQDIGVLANRKVDTSGGWSKKLRLPSVTDASRKSLTNWSVPSTLCQEIQPTVTKKLSFSHWSPVQIDTPNTLDSVSAVSPMPFLPSEGSSHPHYTVVASGVAPSWMPKRS